MTRSKFRQFWLASLVVMLLATSYAYNNTKEVSNDISRQEKRLDYIQQQIKISNSQVDDLKHLNEVTLNQKEVTTLHILRYLNLESSPYTLQMSAPVERQVAGTKLHFYKAKIRGEDSYAKVMNLIDNYYNMNKFNLYHVELKQTNGFGDVVAFEIDGIIYGLDK